MGEAFKAEMSISAQTVDKVYSYTKKYNIASPTQFRPRRRSLIGSLPACAERQRIPRGASSFPQGARRWRPAGALLTGGVAFPFRKDELGDCHPLKPLYNNTYGVWGAAPIGFPKGENDCAGVWPAQLG